MRFFLKREAGTLGITELLVVVLLADAAQNAMADEYRSLTDGVLLTLIIVLWAYFLDFLGYKFPTIRRWYFRLPLLLIKDGELEPESPGRNF